MNVRSSSALAVLVALLLACPAGSQAALPPLQLSSPVEGTHVADPPGVTDYPTATFAASYARPNKSVYVAISRSRATDKFGTLASHEVDFFELGVQPGTDGTSYSKPDNELVIDTGSVAGTYYWQATVTECGAENPHYQRSTADSCAWQSEIRSFVIDPEPSAPNSAPTATDPASKKKTTKKQKTIRTPSRPRGSWSGVVRATGTTLSESSFGVRLSFTRSRFVRGAAAGKWAVRARGCGGRLVYQGKRGSYWYFKRKTTFGSQPTISCRDWGGASVRVRFRRDGDSARARIYAVWVEYYDGVAVGWLD